MSHERPLSLSSSSEKGTFKTNFRGTAATLFKSDDFVEVKINPRPMDSNSACRMLSTFAPEEALVANHSSNSATPSSELVVPDVSSGAEVEDKKVDGALMDDALPLLPIDAKPEAVPSMHGRSNISNLLGAIVVIE